MQIDGSYGEGGGQILRTSVSLSAITGTPVEIFNIRARRTKPGLQPQHLAAVRAAAAICGASLRGDAVGSVHLIFEPLHETRAQEYEFDIGTAGATTLVAQTVLVPLSLASGRSRVTVKGGTHNPMAPTADYLEHVYAATLVRFGYSFHTSYGPPGFYPRGGGRLLAEIEPAETRLPFKVIPAAGGVHAHVTTSSLPETVAQRSETVLREQLSEVRVSTRSEAGVSTGAAVTLSHGSQAGFSALGERGKPMERVTQDAIDLLRRWQATGAAVDEHLADQLVLPALFASGPSSWTTSSVTEHLRTVLWVAGHLCEFEYDLD